jgi:hypothetical protein
MWFCFDDSLQVPFLVELCGFLPAIIRGLEGLGIVAREFSIAISETINTWSTGGHLVSITTIISGLLRGLSAAADGVSH